MTLTSRIIEYLRKHPKSTAHMVQKDLGGTPQQIVQTLYRLGLQDRVDSKRMIPRRGTVGLRATDEVLHYWIWE